MKKIFYTIPLLLSLITYSCEEDFSPNEEFKERYILFGMIYNNLGIKAELKLLKTNNMEVFNRYNNVIAGANVILSSGGIEFKMVEDTIKHYDSIDVYYKVDNLPIFLAHEKFMVTARLPNGRILKAATNIPDYPRHTYSYQFDAITTKIDRAKYGNSWIISWDSDCANLYIPKLYLSYSEWIEGKHEYWYWAGKNIEIPLKYIQKEGKYEPVYPGAVWVTKLEYSFDAIDTTMARLSAGANDKSRYRINKIVFANSALDINYSNYFSSTNGFLDEYSIRIDESTFSNVSGGIGVFGSSTSSLVEFQVDQSYKELFGFK